LFSDIRGFTAMSEKREPQEIVRMLNEYFELMVDVIFKHEGTLDKFVGDEIVALFGAPVALPNAEIKAVECALDMIMVLAEFNRQRAAEGKEEIKIGVGVNTGTVVTGAIGSSRAAVHGHWRCREHSLPTVQRGQGQRNSGLGSDLCPRSVGGERHRAYAGPG